MREDLEKSLTELNNLSLSICNSEVSDKELFYLGGRTVSDTAASRQKRFVFVLAWIGWVLALLGLASSTKVGVAL